MKLPARLASLTFVVLLTACGPQAAPEPASDGQESETVLGLPEEVGACPPGGVDGTPESLDVYLEPGGWSAVTWGEASGLEALGVASPDASAGVSETVRVRLRDTRSLHGDMPAEITMLPTVAEAARLELEHDATLLLRVGDYDGFEPFATLVVSLRVDGVLAALGACAYGLYTEPLEQWLHALLERDPALDSRADALRTYLTSPDAESYALAVEAVHGPEAPGPPGWDDLAPQERQIDVEFTPRDVYEELEVVEVAIRLPEGWWTTDNTLCLRISIGWGSCTTLHGGMVGVDRDGVALRGYWLPGDDMEVWLLGADADVRQPVARLQTIDAALLAEGHARGGLLLTPEPSIVDLAALLESVARDEDVFTVEPADVWR